MQTDRLIIASESLPQVGELHVRRPSLGVLEKVSLRYRRLPVVPKDLVSPEEKSAWWNKTPVEFGGRRTLAELAILQILEEEEGLKGIWAYRAKIKSSQGFGLLALSLFRWVPLAGTRGWPLPTAGDRVAGTLLRGVVAKSFSSRSNVEVRTTLTPTKKRGLIQRGVWGFPLVPLL